MPRVACAAPHSAAACEATGGAGRDARPMAALGTSVLRQAVKRGLGWRRARDGRGGERAQREGRGAWAHTGQELLCNTPHWYISNRRDGATSAARAASAAAWWCRARGGASKPQGDPVGRQQLRGTSLQRVLRTVCAMQCAVRAGQGEGARARRAVATAGLGNCGGEDSSACARAGLRACFSSCATQTHTLENSSGRNRASMKQRGARRHAAPCVGRIKACLPGGAAEKGCVEEARRANRGVGGCGWGVGGRQRARGSGACRRIASVRAGAPPGAPRKRSVRHQGAIRAAAGLTGRPPPCRSTCPGPR